MLPIVGLLQVVFASPAAAAPCESRVSRAGIGLGLAEAQTAFAELDIERFNAAEQSLRAQVPCLRDALMPSDVAQLHVVDALAAFRDERDDRVVNAWRSVVAAEPGFEPDPAVIPAGHPLRAHFQLARGLGDGATVRLAATSGELWRVDGRPTEVLPTDRPMIAQRVGGDGAVLATAWLSGDEERPSWLVLDLPPVAVVMAPASPAPEEPEEPEEPERTLARESTPMGVAVVEQPETLSALAPPPPPSPAPAPPAPPAPVPRVEAPPPPPTPSLSAQARWVRLQLRGYTGLEPLVRHDQSYLSGGPLADYSAAYFVENPLSEPRLEHAGAGGGVALGVRLTPRFELHLDGAFGVGHAEAWEIEAGPARVFWTSVPVFTSGVRAQVSTPGRVQVYGFFGGSFRFWPTYTEQLISRPWLMVLGDHRVATGQFGGGLSTGHRETVGWFMEFQQLGGPDQLGRATRLHTGVEIHLGER
jgi:hypothetical protein